LYGVSVEQSLEDGASEGILYSDDCLGSMAATDWNGELVRGLEGRAHPVTDFAMREIRRRRLGCMGDMVVMVRTNNGLRRLHGA
jgi:hypothetical protein